jgi:hypothetical protein
VKTMYSKQWPAVQINCRVHHCSALHLAVR